MTITTIKKIRHGADERVLGVLAYSFNALIALACLIPFVMVVSASLSSETAVRDHGFSLLPQDFSLEAYGTIFKNPGVVGKAYLVTICLTVFGTVLGLFIQTMTAYVLSRRDFGWRNKFSFFFYFTTLFNGGLVPSYILMTRYLHLKNNYLALLLPLLFSVYNLLIMKSYIRAIPDSLIDAAKIDGCGEFRILVQIIMPMLKPAMATVGLFIALAYWNDWYNAMLYIENKNMQPLQYFLYNQVNNIEAYKKILEAHAGASAASAINMPTQTLKMALTVVVTGPIILLYPMVQKYFVQGITIGAVKG
ncbi:sugar ABC transporter permease [Spirochaetia bacterium]|nr:sugar ABC transporter permease [Spirochaetia bacterium]